MKSTFSSLPAKDREAIVKLCDQHPYAFVLDILARPRAQGGFGIRASYSSLQRFYVQAQPKVVSIYALQNFAEGCQFARQRKPGVFSATILALLEAHVVGALKDGAAPADLEKELRLLTSLQRTFLATEKWRHDFSGLVSKEFNAFIRSCADQEKQGGGSTIEIDPAPEPDTPPPPSAEPSPAAGPANSEIPPDAFAAQPAGQTSTQPVNQPDPEAGPAPAATPAANPVPPTDSIDPSLVEPALIDPLDPTLPEDPIEEIERWRNSLEDKRILDPGLQKDLIITKLKESILARGLPLPEVRPIRHRADSKLPGQNPPNPPVKPLCSPKNFSESNNPSAPSPEPPDTPPPAGTSE